METLTAVVKWSRPPTPTSHLPAPKPLLSLFSVGRLVTSSLGGDWVGCVRLSEVCHGLNQKQIRNKDMTAISLHATVMPEFFQTPQAFNTPQPQSDKYNSFIYRRSDVVALKKVLILQNRTCLVLSYQPLTNNWVS